MAISQVDIDTFDNNYMKDAVVRQRHQDREQELMPADDRIKMRNFMENSVARQSGPQQVRQVRFYSQSGWGS